MNLVRQRDDLKAAAAAGAIKREMADAALSSPVFQWWSGNQERTDKYNKGERMSPDEEEFITSYLMEVVQVPSEGPDKPATTVIWPKLTPYPVFRMSYLDVPMYDQWFIWDETICCFHCDDGFSMEGIKVWTLHVKKKSRMGYWMLKVWVNGKEMELPRDKDWGSPESIHDIDVGRFTMRITKDMAVEYAGNVTQMLGVFLFDIYGSGNTVVKVSPKPDATKSVQWRQAREHYLVLRRHQVEKLRESKGTVSDEDIVRSAHWRRAHLRRLSSNKFINKRGLLVPVKRAWVGPTEWQGNDGKIYTVVGMGPPPLTGIN